MEGSGTLSIQVDDTVTFFDLRAESLSLLGLLLL